MKLFALIFQLAPSSKRWRYRLEEDFSIYLDALRGVYFSSEWFSIKDGEVFVKAGYAWDGVTPAFYCFGIWMGIWDGPKGRDGKVCSWKATLVHDCLCQFIGLIQDIKKAQTVEAFQKLLEINESPRWMCSIYPFFVKYFGPQDWT